MVEKLPNFKKNFFWEFANTYPFDLVSWSFHETKPKMIFLTIFAKKNWLFLVIFAKWIKNVRFLVFWGKNDQKKSFFFANMVKNIIFGLVSWNDHDTRSKGYVLANSQKKLFLKLGNFPTLYDPLKYVQKYIYERIWPKCHFWFK